MPLLVGSDLVNLALLGVELFLLIVTITLLTLNRREQHGRDRLLDRLSAATDVVSRQEYFVTVLGSIQGARRTLCGVVTGSAPPTEEGEVIHQVTNAISQAVAKGVKVQYLLPSAPDRLQMAQRYVNAGAEVRFNPEVLVSDARYMVVDNQSVVIGVPERKGRNEPTRKGYVVPSESVASLFRDEFEKRWDSKEAKAYLAYLAEVVGKARQSNPAISAELIATNLKLDRKDVDSILKQLG
ncbi:MAG: hypothetical protein LYZ66_06100 [Nitrososphaerales archaeon]|nr:hypothetical protein [Nitrososphaerales archaeon]